ncbi:sensor domain-containing diguanylate cyclase [Pseudomonas sp. B21-023]|uniref:sensor domain-containing diguanylate cyclase n=1 Tax=unclassified Pseudomonas TaxID=196821 RepID=UPI00111B2EC7|nr:MULTISPECIES: sensor domain-containing diguanylate cyclase [unclassified Pseudomonas]UVL17304.1 sensor domain-containing diguanylate cyclase [Pseudomonas sp. B21-044]UVM14657.1 sensor domain-containing diguanylate cyclase [Pseudomonas sp. B21-023]
MPPHARRPDLRTLILALCAITALVMLLASYFASYRVQRQLLIDSALEANRAYAAKVAAVTENTLGNALQQLAYSASQCARHPDDVNLVQAEIDRLQQQSNLFNSTLRVSAQGVVRTLAPAPLQHLAGTQASSAASREALRERRTLVSTPFLSAAGNLLVIMSQPIFDADGRYQGYIGGSLYLRERNLLNSLLGTHFYQNGAYLYVIDRNRRLLFHPDSQRVGTLVGDNSLVDELPHLDHGTRRLVNSQGVEMLAGFATVPSTGWAIVSQQPLQQTVAPLRHLILNVIAISAPLALLGCLLLCWLTQVIAHPLRQLATVARGTGEQQTTERIHQVRAWYAEAAELKRALLFGLNLLQERIGRLNHDAQTDPLTGLLNRRGLQQALRLLQAEKRGFAVVVLDIDHFKRINDNHGHDIGDLVLQRLAGLMRGTCREGDLLCRTGGEEFLMLLPGAGLEVATAIAGHLRLTVEHTPIEPIGGITLSLGVASWQPLTGDEPGDTLRKADQALYRAKQKGRNRVCIDSQA